MLKFQHADAIRVRRHIFLIVGASMTSLSPSVPTTTARTAEKPIPIQESAFAFTSGLTYAEYLAELSPSPMAGFLRKRRADVRIGPKDQAYFATYPKWIYIVALLTDDTPDTLMILPIVDAVADAGPRLDMHIVRDEDDLSLLNDLIEDDLDLDEDLDDIDLPLLFFFDDEWNEKGRWGPRPQAAESRLDLWLEQHPEYESLLADENADDSEQLANLMTQLTHQMCIWYNDDLTEECVGEIRAVLSTIHPNSKE